MLKDVLNHAAIWRGKELLTLPESSVPGGIDSGFTELNEQLTEGGWPTKGIIEILYDQAGAGELSLLLPVLRRYCQDQRWLTWIAPPYRLHAPALQQAGIDTQQVMQIWPHNQKDCLWTIEETMKSRASSAVLCWPGQLKPEHVRRLQIVANQYRMPCFLFRQQGACNTPCALRIHIKSLDHRQAQIHILKRQRGWSPAPFSIELRQCTPYRYQKHNQTVLVKAPRQQRL